jgi:hypothetical protein
MKTVFLFAMLFFGLVQANESCGEKAGNVEKNKNTSPTPQKKGENWRPENLPDDVKPETKVRIDVKNDKGQVTSTSVTTVEKTLNGLKARFENGKLVDRNGREIRFFAPLCRGVSQGPEEDEAARKAREKELSELEKKFTVIVLYCDPASVM